MKSRLAGIMLAVCFFSGCITSPFYAQILKARSAEVPVEVWTPHKLESFTLECAQASAHGGPYNGDGSYQLVTSFAPSPRAHYDYKGGSVYHASTKVVIPDECWRSYSYPDGANFITVLRILQGTHGDGSIYTYDTMGLGCLGQSAGANGLGGFAACAKKWVNTGEFIRTVFLKAKL